MALEVAFGVDIAPRTQPTLLACQKAPDDAPEWLVGSVRAGLGPLDGGVVAEPDLGEQIARCLARLRRVEDLGRADGHAALPTAQRILHDEGARAACSQSHTETWDVVVENDHFALARRQREPVDAG